MRTLAACHRHAVAAFVVVFAALFSSYALADEKTIGVPRDDSEMVKAIERARTTLPLFWETYERRPRNETDFNLKVKLTDGRKVEHFWIGQIERKDGKVYGIVSNDPNSVHTVKKGQRIEIIENDISDWLFYRDGKMVGNQTVRAMFKYMPPDQVKRFKEMLESP